MFHFFWSLLFVKSEQLFESLFPCISRLFSSCWLEYFLAFSPLELYTISSFTYIIFQWLWLSCTVSSASSCQRDDGFSIGVSHSIQCLLWLDHKLKAFINLISFCSLMKIQSNQHLFQKVSLNLQSQLDVSVSWEHIWLHLTGNTTTVTWIKAGGFSYLMQS